MKHRIHPTDASKIFKPAHWFHICLLALRSEAAVIAFKMRGTTVNGCCALPDAEIFQKGKRLLLCLLLDNDSSQYLAFCPFNHHVSLRKPAFTATIFQHSLYPPCRPTHSPSTLFHRSIEDSHHCCVDRGGHHDHLCAIQFPIGSPSAAECSDTCNPRGIPHSRACLLWSSFES